MNREHDSKKFPSPRGAGRREQGASAERLRLGESPHLGPHGEDTAAAAAQQGGSGRVGGTHGSTVLGACVCVPACVCVRACALMRRAAAEGVLAGKEGREWLLPHQCTDVHLTT